MGSNVMDQSSLENDSQQAAADMPETIGRYRIRRVLGVGAMGEVLLAWDPKLGREVAIKIVAKRQRDNPRVKERFIREAQAIAALNHPNIVQIYDTSTMEGDDLYLVIEKLDGKDLYEVMGQYGVVPETIAAAMGHELCLALEAAHAAGIVHRDLKPENVFLSRSGRVVLTDFGIVKAVRDGSAVSGFRERTEIIGTPGFMSPEQMRGAALTSSIDIFALGALLYNVATLHMPHSGATPVAVYQAALQGRIVDAKRHSPLLSDAFCEVINRCLQPNAEQRFHSAAEVRLALRAVLDQLGASDVRDELAQYVREPTTFAQKAQRRNIDYTLAALTLAEQAKNNSEIDNLRQRLAVLDPYHDRLKVQLKGRGFGARKPRATRDAGKPLSELLLKSRWLTSQEHKTARATAHRPATTAWLSFGAIALMTALGLVAYGPHDTWRPATFMMRSKALGKVLQVTGQTVLAPVMVSEVDADDALKWPAMVNISTGEVEATLTVDRTVRSVGNLGRLMLPAGEHVIMLTARGYRPLLKRIVVEPRERLSLVADMARSALMVP